MGSTPDKLPEHCCAKCHFFCTFTLGGNRPYQITTGNIEECLLESFKSEFYGMLCDDYLMHDGHIMFNSVGCYHRVWNIAKIDQPKEEQPIRTSTELIKDRNDFCFFYSKIKGMSFEAAETLERRAADRREAEKDRVLAAKAADAAQKAAEAADINSKAAIDAANAAIDSVKTSKKALWWAIVALFLNAALVIISFFLTQKVTIVPPEKNCNQKNTIQKSVNRILEMRALDDKTVISNK